MESFEEPFCSEADFQHSLAWELHKKFNAKIILEYPCKNKDKMVYYDMYVKINGKVHLIELKYRTKAVGIKRYGQEITLKNHSAQDMGCCHFWLDVQRLETTKIKSDSSYCIMLTNDNWYFEKGPRDNSICKNFSLKHDITAKKKIKLNTKDEEKVKTYWPKNAEEINLNNNYKCIWMPCPEMQYGEWKYLLLEITK